MAIDSNMKRIIGITLKLLFPILCLKCSYVNACVVTMVEKAFSKHVKVGQMEAKKSILILLLARIEKDV